MADLVVDFTDFEQTLWNSLDIFGIDSDDSEGESGLKCLANIGDLIHRDISR